MQKTFEEICTFEVLYRAYLAAHGNTYTLRQKIASQVSEIIGIPLRCHAPIRLSKKQKAMLEDKKRRKASQNAALPAAPEHHGADVPW